MTTPNSIAKNQPSITNTTNPMTGIRYEPYEGEYQLEEMVPLIETDLSEPYSIYTYRFFLKQWPDLCFLVNFKSLWRVCNMILIIVMIIFSFLIR